MKLLYFLIFLWITGGNPVAQGSGDQLSAGIEIGWFGDAFIVWEDRNTSEIYLTSISNGSGNERWASPLNISNSPYQDRSPDIISDDVDGYCVVVWSAQNSSGDFDIYAKRVDMDGNVLWETPICVYSGDQINSLIEQDRLWPANKAIIVWEDERGGTKDIYAQRIRPYDGTTEWTQNGKLLFSNARLMDAVETVRKIFIFYKDSVNGEYRVSMVDDSSGNVLWTRTIPGKILKNSPPVNSNSGTGGIFIPYQISDNEWWLMNLKYDNSVVFDI